jgi:plastocyanin
MTTRSVIAAAVASANNAFKKSQALDTDDSYSFAFATPGTYAYFCCVHPFMKGTIVVEAASG